MTTFDLQDLAERVATSVSLTPAGKTAVATDLAVGEFGLAVLDAICEATSPLPRSLATEIREHFVGKGYLSNSDESVFARALRERERAAA